MGYAATTIVLYGVKLPEYIAKKIYMNALDTDDETVCLINVDDKDKYYRKLTSHCKAQGRSQKLPISSYSQHGVGAEGAEVFFPDMLSEGADSRCENLSFEPGYNHFFGIHVGSKGYGPEDDIAYFCKNMPEEAIKNFKLYIEPILKEHGITDEPDLILCNQTW